MYGLMPKGYFSAFYLRTCWSLHGVWVLVMQAAGKCEQRIPVHPVVFLDIAIQYTWHHYSHQQEPILS